MKKVLLFSLPNFSLERVIAAEAAQPFMDNFTNATELPFFTKAPNGFDRTGNILWLGPELWGKKGGLGADFPEHGKYSTFFTQTLLVMVWFWNVVQAFYTLLMDAWKYFVKFWPFLPELRGKRVFLAWGIVSECSRTFMFFSFRHF